MPTNTNYEKLLTYAAEAYVNEEIEAYKNEDRSNIVIGDKLINKVMHQIGAATTGKDLLHTFKKVACIILAVSITVFSISMSIPSVRASVRAIIETVFERYIDIRWITDNKKLYPEKIENTYLPQLDADWSLENTFENPYMVKHSISGTKQEHVIFTQSIYNTDITQTIDDNYSSVEEIPLPDSVPAYLYTYSDGTMILLWLDRYAFTMVAEHTPRETLLSLAASVTPQ